MADYHIPVLLHTCVEALNINPNGVYVDVTFGGGGHSKAILEKLSESGKLIAFDQDPDAAVGAPKQPNFQLIPSNFRFLKNYLKMMGIAQIDGLLADLGVSSHQFDVAERGFSIRFDAPLDMRMDKQSKISAHTVLNHYTAEQISKILKVYGEVYQADKLTQRILKARVEKPIETTFELVGLLKGLSKPEQLNSLAAQVFQAIRIEVNGEMESLKQLLKQAIEVLKPEGRLVVLSYHSLEDRMVKHFIRSGTEDGEPIKDFFGKTYPPLEAVHRKPIRPSTQEIEQNNRARSAILRIAQRTTNEPIQTKS